MTNPPDSPTPADHDVPLCVDLDGTLIATDLLVESAMHALRRRPMTVVSAMRCYASSGRSAMKCELATGFDLDASMLPYRTDVIDFLRAERNRGRKLVLVTAADESLARRVADHLGLFDETIGSSRQSNLKSQAKLAKIRERFPDGFDYVGDSAHDHVIWEAARTAYLVAPSGATARWAQTSLKNSRVLVPRLSRTAALRKALRPHQWVKNALVLLPLFFAHQVRDTHLLTKAIFATIAFCLAASGVYIVNDAFDVESDRRHHTKRSRPFASGALPLAWAPALAAALFGTAFLIGLFLSRRFEAVLALYALMSLGYSWYFKSRLLLDVILLAGLYTVRLIAGGAATGVEVSPWLFAFSMFMFTSLAFAKRYAELRNTISLQSTDVLPGRSYMRDDLQILASVGPAAGQVAVLVLALYINSDLVRQLYHRPSILWLICPVVLYWTTRVWFFANRGALNEDPILFATKDKVSWLSLIACAAIVGAATIL